VPMPRPVEVRRMDSELATPNTIGTAA